MEQLLDVEYLYDQSVVLTYGPAMWPFMKKKHSKLLCDEVF